MDIRLAIFDVAGRRIKDLSSDLVSGIMNPVSWNGTDDNGYSIPDGVYFVRLAVPGQALVKTVVKTR